MGEKLIGLFINSNVTKKHSVGLKRKLMSYWAVMVSVILILLFLILYMAGVFSAPQQKAKRILQAELNSIHSEIEQHFDNLTARILALSTKANKSIGQRLYTDGIEKLNDEPDEILKLEYDLYSQINATMQASFCNGAFVIINATTNTKAAGMDKSRAGVYLRFTNLNSKNDVNQDITLFRGHPSLARSNNIELHNRWNLEFDVSHTPYYVQHLNSTVSRLADSCIVSGRTNILDTWEEAITVTVPILSNDGRVWGVCGIELSEFYFHLYYPTHSSEFGNVITVCAPVSDGKLLLNEGITGGLDGIYLNTGDTFIIKEGDYFNTYIGESGEFIGLQQKLDTKINGKDTYVVSLISMNSYNITNMENKIFWTMGTLIIIAVIMLISLRLIARFVYPISQAITAVGTDEAINKEPSGILEIDKLIQFINSRKVNHSIKPSELPSDVEELLNDFAQKAKTLTATERSIIRYYSEGKEVNEVAELAFISIHTVRRHNANMYRKLNIGSREELMLYLELFRRCNRLSELLGDSDDLQ